MKKKLVSMVLSTLMICTLVVPTVMADTAATGVEDAKEPTVEEPIEERVFVDYGDLPILEPWVLGSSNCVKFLQEKLIELGYYGEVRSFYRIKVTEYNEIYDSFYEDVFVGFDVDGVFGAKVVEAVEALQRENNLEVDAIVGPQTWKVLIDELDVKAAEELQMAYERDGGNVPQLLDPSFTLEKLWGKMKLANHLPILYKRSPYVDYIRALKYQLKEKGYYCGDIDGKYDVCTQEAVMNFQEANGLNPDGIVGPKTWSALKLA